MQNPNMARSLKKTKSRFRGFREILYASPQKLALDVPMLLRSEAFLLISDTRLKLNSIMNYFMTPTNGAERL